MINIGLKIKTLRKEAKMSQEILAEKLNVSQDTISLWERDKSYPDVENIIKLCKIFEVTSDYLLGLTDY